MRRMMLMIHPSNNNPTALLVEYIPYIYINLNSDPDDEFVDNYNGDYDYNHRDADENHQYPPVP